MNTDNFLINNSDIEAAQDTCKLIENSSIRNRAIANSMAAEIATKYFDNETYEVDSESGLHNIGFVLENLEISDIYVNKNYIDVRVFFSEDEMSVPVAHFENNILPVAYMFIKINDDLSGATVIGFVEPNAVMKKNQVCGYYQVTETDLKSFYDIEPLLTDIEDVDEIEDRDIFAYLDKNLENVSIFYETLLKSKISRKKLAKAAKAKDIFRFVSVTKEFNIKENDDIAEKSNGELSLDNENSLFDTEDDSISDSELIPETFDVDELTLGQSDDLLEVEDGNGIEVFDINPTEEADSLIPDIEVSDESFELELEEAVPHEVSFMSDTDTEVNNVADTDYNDNDVNSDLAETLEHSISVFTANIEHAAENNNSEEIRELDVQSEIQVQNSFDMHNSSSDTSLGEELAEAHVEDDGDVEPLTLENSIEENALEPLILENSVVEDNNKNNENIEKDINVEPTEETEAEFSFSTVTTPSLSEDDNILAELSNEVEVEEPVQNEENHESQVVQEQQIGALFNNDMSIENQDEAKQADDFISSQYGKKSSVNPLIALIVLVIIGTAGYIGYTKFFNSSANNDMLNSDIPSDTKQIVDTEPNTAIEDAMPIETVTNVTQNNSNEGISEAIPVIEQNLDASILVSNLKVDWEVPAGYAANTSAKRYLVKLGKIIQLNLKTELLLLSKPPITNKIAVEIKYNSDDRKFETTGITVSSGEKSVDALILQTVNRALSMNLSMNTDSFAKLQGNPVLIIHL